TTHFSRAIFRADGGLDYSKLTSQGPCEEQQGLIVSGIMSPAVILAGIRPPPSTLATHCGGFSMFCGQFRTLAPRLSPIASLGAWIIATNWALASPPGTAFTYQGQLKQSGSPVNASVAMSFKLWDAATGGNQQGPTLVYDGNGPNPPAVSVVNGLLTV